MKPAFVHGPSSAMPSLSKEMQDFESQEFEEQASPNGFPE